VLGIVLIGLGVLEALSISLSGLWLAMIGWFVLNGAASERYASTAERVRGLRVRDVMTGHPIIAPGSLTISEFVAGLTPALSAQAVFPIVDQDGQPLGVVSWTDLERIQRDRRPLTRLRDIAHRGDTFFVVSPESELPDIVLPLHLRDGYAVVVDRGRLVGLVSEADLSASADRARPYRVPS
jgi:CBS domain-containing protein